MKRSLGKKLVLASIMMVSGALGSCNSGPGTGHAAPPTKDAVSLQDRVARGLIAASPPADPADAKARDAAGEKLSALGDLVGAAGEQILWGGFDSQRGYDPKAYRLTEFSPFVWAKVYLSSFVFPGGYEVRREGRFTVLEVRAKFRDGLDAGDYPYPFWHSQTKWKAYVDTSAILLVFEQDRLRAAFRRASPDPGKPVAERKWDGRWRWSDEAGHEQPRVALFSYLFSADNPSLPRVEQAYRNLEENFRHNNCVGCHAPDNLAKARSLQLLNYPNQALVARHSLVEVLRRNAMPPADAETGGNAGLSSETARREILALAEQFEREADAALAFEKERGAAKGGAPR